MKQLDINEEKIIFVINKENQLIGSLTDGDVRRWILRDGNLSEQVHIVCFKGTFFVSQNYNLDNIKTEVLKREIVFVPVVDENNVIVEFLNWDTLFNGEIKREIKDKLDVPVVIMAGGKGTRLDPFTRILPKPLIPIGDKSLLEIIIEKFVDYGISKYHISVNHKAKIIKSYFDELNPNYSMKYLYEDKPLGTVGALKQLENKVNGNLILTNCDIIINADYSDLLKYHDSVNNDITLVVSMKHYNIPYGICEIENGGTLLEIKEKPEYDLLVNTGMYVLKSDTLKYIPQNEYFHITHLIEKIKKAGMKVGVYPISENSWFDTGEWVEYKKTLEQFKLWLKIKLF